MALDGRVAEWPIGLREKAQKWWLFLMKDTNSVRAWYAPTTRAGPSVALRGRLAFLAAVSLNWRYLKFSFVRSRRQQAVRLHSPLLLTKCLSTHGSSNSSLMSGVCLGLL